MKTSNHSLFVSVFIFNIIFILNSNDLFAGSEMETEEENLKRIVTLLEAGVSKGETEDWKNYMADDGVLVNRDGSKNTKEEIMAELSPKPKGIELNIIPQFTKICVHSNSALVSFVADEKLNIHGQKVDTQYPSIMYFEKRNGKWQMVFFTYFEKPVDPKPIKVSHDYLQAFEGTYQVNSDMTIEVNANDSALVYKKPGSYAKATVLLPIDNSGHFFRTGTESEFIFKTSDEGRKILIQRRNWIDLVWTKKE
jgi:hypothetical protein